MTGNFAFLNIGQVCLMLTKAAHPQLSFSEIAIVTIRAQQLRVYFYTSDQKVIRGHFRNQVKSTVQISSFSFFDIVSRQLYY